jgi:hypothetical protein
MHETPHAPPKCSSCQGSPNGWYCTAGLEIESGEEGSSGILVEGRVCPSRPHCCLRLAFLVAICVPPASPCPVL